MHVSSMLSIRSQVEQSVFRLPCIRKQAPNGIMFTISSVHACICAFILYHEVGLVTWFISLSQRCKKLLDGTPWLQKLDADHDHTITC